VSGLSQQFKAAADALSAARGAIAAYVASYPQCTWVAGDNFGGPVLVLVGGADPRHKDCEEVAAARGRGSPALQLEV
jgi:hypothetical protein